MKSLNEYLQETKSKNPNIGDLQYVMTYKALKEFVKSLDKQESFRLIVHTDDSMEVSDYLYNEISYFYYNDENKDWYSYTEDDAVKLSEFTVSNEDIILLFKAN